MTAETSTRSSPQVLVMIVERETAIEQILEQLYEMGIRATVLRSRGMQRTLQEDIPLFTGLAAGVVGSPSHHRTILSVIDDEDLLQRAIDSVTAVCAEYEGERTGIVFTLPVGFFRHL